MATLFPAKDRSLIRAGLLCFLIAAVLLWLVARCAGADLLDLHARVIALRALSPTNSLVVISNPPTHYSLVWTNAPLPGTNNVYSALIQSKTDLKQSWVVAGLVESNRNAMRWDIPMNHRQDFFRVVTPAMRIKNDGSSNWVPKW